MSPRLTDEQFYRHLGRLHRLDERKSRAGDTALQRWSLRLMLRRERGRRLRFFDVLRRLPKNLFVPSAPCPPACACRCHGPEDDPGPDHLPTCAWSDPEYTDGGEPPTRQDLAAVVVAVQTRKSAGVYRCSKCGVLGHNRRTCTSER